MARWRANVGEAVARDFALPPGRGPAPDSSIGGSRAGRPNLVVLSWNVWIGRGRLAALIDRVRKTTTGTAGQEPVDLIVLAQEARRADNTIPVACNGARGRDLIVRSWLAEDIVEVAATAGLNLRYAPSMRNGSLRSDRGNAILSTLPVVEAAAFELPWVLQRRVAVSATLALPSTGDAPATIRVCSAHLDPRGSAGSDWLGGAGRAAQAHELLHRVAGKSDGPEAPVVIGADLNLVRGAREPAYQMMMAAGFTNGIPGRPPAWDHTYHAVPRLPLDYLLFRDRNGSIAGAEVRRLDEHPADRGPYVFGSDHHPLLAQIELNHASGSGNDAGQ